MTAIDTIHVGDIYLNTGSGSDIIIRKVISESGQVEIEHGSPEYWHSRNTITIDQLRSKYIKLDCSYEEMLEQGAKYSDSLPVFEIPEEETTALMSTDSFSLINARAAHLSKIDEQMVMVRLKMDRHIKSIENKMNALKNKLNNQMSIVRQQLSGLQRIITSIELFLGIGEELVQFQSGEPCPVEEPICFRQRLLFMDEEIAVTENGGFDFSNIEDFLKWLGNPKNLQRVLPDKKGMVALKYRRYSKDYGDRYENAAKDQLNRETFFLFRNGENVYYIYTDRLQITDRLFPKREEFQQLMEQSKTSSWDYERKDAKDKQSIYLSQLLFMQGLVLRTHIFHPLPENFNFGDFNDGHVIPIYDEEDALLDGKERFKDWQKRINLEIKRGSRIVMSAPAAAFAYQYRENERQRRSTRHYSNSWRLPDWPNAGMYEVEEYENGALLTILYNPKDSVGYYIDWSKDNGGWHYGERKNRVRFIIKPTDSFVLNYDLITLEDIEYYMDSRIDRPHYLDMLPVLHEVRKEKIRELKSEQLFIDLVVNETGKSRADVELAVKWWKFKTIFKRPIDSDDAKAFRMIVGRLTSAKRYKELNPNVEVH